MMTANKLLLVTTLAVVLLQCAAIDSAESWPDCSKVANGVRLVDPSSCTNFIICYNMRPVRRACPRGLYFDDTTLNCNYAALVKCSRFPGSQVETDDLTVIKPNATDLASQVTCTCAPTCSTACTATPAPCTATPAPCTATPAPCTSSSSSSSPSSCTTNSVTCTPSSSGSPTVSTTPCNSVVTTNTPCNDSQYNHQHPVYPYPPPPQYPYPPPPQYPYWQAPWQLPCFTPCPTTTTTTTAATNTTTTTEATSDAGGTKTEGVFYADPTNRRKFYVVQNGKVTNLKCSLTQWFDEETKTCRNKSYFKTTK